MKPWVAAGLIAFVISSLVIGIRLLALWRRTRRLPELLISFGILGIGPVGFAFILLAMSASETLPALSRMAFAASLLATMGGSFATAIFNWRVFRPEQRRVRRVVEAVALLFVFAFLWEAYRSGFADLSQAADGYRLSSMLTTVILLWGAGESLRYYAMMRRRTRLGLADPLVTNRFLLWGLGIGAAGVGCVISVGGQLATGQHMLQIPWLTISNSLHGFTSAVLMWVAFLPPAFYCRFIASRARSAG